MADGRYWLTHDAQDIDDTIDEVQAARGESASLSARLAEQDADIGTKATVGDIFGIPSTSIAPAEGTTGTLAAYTTPGMYTVPTGTAASRLTDSPLTDKGFIMEVRQYRSGTYYRQTIYAWNEAGAFYTRSRTGGANWTAWYKFEGTQVAVSAQSAPASLMQAGRIEAELTDAGTGEEEEER